MFVPCLHLNGDLSFQPKTMLENSAALPKGMPSASTLSDRLGRAYDRAGYVPFEIVNGVAVILIKGALVKDGAWIEAPWDETSYQGLQTQIARAARNPEVKGVAFEVNSFGGMINGAFETAAMISGLSKEKPTIAILTDFGYSAAYLLASQARQIVMPKYGGAGSIGAVRMHVDFSRALDAAGINVSLIYSGAHKTEGNQIEPLPDETRDRWKAEVDRIRDDFAAVVGKGRGQRVTKALALKTEAQAFTAAEALDRGLVDAVGDGQEAFSAFVKAVNRRT